MDGAPLPAASSRVIVCTHSSIALNQHYEGDACAFDCEDIVSKRLGSPYRSGRTGHWIKVKNPKAPAVRREAQEDWGR